jgi:hypothetical protein
MLGPGTHRTNETLAITEPAPQIHGNTRSCSRIEYPATSSRGDIMKAPFLIGRIIFGGFFLYSGIHHLLKDKEMAPYAGSNNVPAPNSPSS